MKVVRQPCGCCGTQMSVNMWSLAGNSSVRCPVCRAARCSNINRKARCGQGEHLGLHIYNS